ncbi:hypothetical protein [Glutamicibacter sp.]|jgi:hypothetical protein|uniref:hypothetical protein n=1 Tax=Glutamicibacter sp. TaxID=1931995 RepID=UPI002B464753|nr:hypothetical protein [Glutamicibacter sp.]HJX78553.1 hypothetical protein [Glutamicibacter sp.]
MAVDDKRKIVELEAQVAAYRTQDIAKGVVIGNLRRWLSDSQFQLAEALANSHLKDQLFQELQNTEGSTE